MAEILKHFQLATLPTAESDISRRLGLVFRIFVERGRQVGDKHLVAHDDLPDELDENSEAPCAYKQ